MICADRGFLVTTTVGRPLRTILLLRAVTLPSSRPVDFMLILIKTTEGSPETRIPASTVGSRAHRCGDINDCGVLIVRHRIAPRASCS